MQISRASQGTAISLKSVSAEETRSDARFLSPLAVALHPQQHSSSWAGLHLAQSRKGHCKVRKEQKEEMLAQL